MREKRKFDTWWYGLLATAGALTIIVPAAYSGWRELAPEPQVGECVRQVEHGAADLRSAAAGAGAPGSSRSARSRRPARPVTTRR